MMARYRSVIGYLIATILFCRILQYSWVTDDAFITFRSVMNFVAGDGPVFNIGERVQSFTHPLWFLLLSIGGILDLNLYFFSIILGLSFSLLAILALFRLHGELGSGNNTLLVLALGVLAASESFISFGTSGLENSLTYFLVIATVIASVDSSRRFAFYFFMALTLLNRFDVIFFLAPLFVSIIYEDWRIHQFRLKTLIVGFFPLVSWHIFSLVYYGFLFPNTKYAKVGGRPFIDNAKSGLSYLVDSMQAEWHVWLLVALLPLSLIVAARSRLLSAVHHRILVALIAGIYLHITYVAFISGGDFMRGRFFTIVALGVSITLLFFRISVSQFAKGGVIVGCGCLFVASAWIGAKEHLLWMAPGVENERNFYKQFLALNLDPEKNYTNHPWAQQARELKPSTPGIIGVIGQRAYWVPRHINLIDPVALTDAFIARSPIIDSSRTGHFIRRIPEEYYISKTQHRNIPEWQDKEAQKLYENVIMVTESSTLFSVDRLKAMFWLWRHYGL